MAEAAATPVPVSGSDKIDKRVLIVSGVVMLGAVMTILDTTIVNVALATLGHQLHSTVDQIQWVVTGYMLALAAVIPVTGWAGKRFGAKQVYLTSLVLFTAGSALCGLATSTAELILFRVLQGAGGGMVMPIGMLMMAEAAGPKRMGRVMSIVAVPMMLAPILGPTLGGVLIQNLSWRWIFYVNVPIGVIAVFAALRTLPWVKPGDAGRLDWRGLVLMSGGAALLTYGLAEIGATGGFSSPKVLLPLFGGIALIALFAVISLRVPRPLLDVRLYRRPTFSTASIAMFALAAALFGGMILLPLYWQEIRHQSVVNAGLLMAPQGLGAALAMPLAGKLSDRYGGGPVALFGTTVTAVMTIPFGLIGAHTSILGLSLAMLVRGTGIGFGMMPAMTAAFASLKREELPDATPQLNVLQRIGGSIGVAILAVVLERSLVGQHTLAGQASAYGTAFWVSGLLAAIAIVPCIILVHAERAARAQRHETEAPADATLEAEALEAAAA
ncbi:MAG TPA: MDR family MFS transporter [Solirubrobacteraceae bacterium]